MSALTVIRASASRAPSEPPPPAWAEAWRDAYAAQQADTAQAKITFYGDSVTEGYYGDTEYWENSWVAQIAQRFATLTGTTTGAVERLGRNVPVADSRLVLSADGWTGAPGNGFFGDGVYSAAGSGHTLTFGPVWASSFKITQMMFTNMGAWTASVDGGASVEFSGYSTTPTLGDVTISAGVEGIHTLTITTIDRIIITAIETVAGGTSGVSCSRIAQGTKNVETLTNGSGLEYGSMASVQRMTSDLSVVAFGLNSESLETFTTNTELLVVELLNQGSVLLVADPPPNGSLTWGGYRTAMQTIADDYGCGFYDFAETWIDYATSSVWYSDGFHPNALGVAQMALELGDYIIDVAT